MILPHNWNVIKNKQVQFFYYNKHVNVSLNNLSSIKKNCNKTSQELSKFCYKKYLRKTNNNPIFTLDENIGFQISKILNSEYQKNKKFEVLLQKNARQNKAILTPPCMKKERKADKTSKSPHTPKSIIHGFRVI